MKAAVVQCVIASLLVCVLLGVYRWRSGSWVPDVATPVAAQEPHLAPVPVEVVGVVHVAYDTPTPLVAPQKPLRPVPDPISVGVPPHRHWYWYVWPWHWCHHHEKPRPRR
jgi:hypothetical protein